MTRYGYVMEEQCTWHPGWGEKPQRAKHINYIPKLASRLWNTILRTLLPKALPTWWVDTERCKPCCNDGGLCIEVKHPLSALVKASAQGVTMSPRNANIGDVIATLDAQHYLLAPMYQQTMGIPNVALWPKMCHCGNLHLKVTAVRPIPARTPLIVELKPVKDTYLVAQFDGSWALVVLVVSYGRLDLSQLFLIRLPSRFNLVQILCLQKSTLPRPHLTRR